MKTTKKLFGAMLIAPLAGGCTTAEEKPQYPNIMLIVLDDMGYSDLGVFGSEIRTPNIDMLARQGVQYTRFHTSSLSAPSRAMLLTGVDNHLNGLGAMPPMASVNQYMQDGYEGSLNNRVATIGELLQQSGYFTFTIGKWHLGTHKGELPNDRGFERSLSLMAGGTSHFDNHFAMCSYDLPVTYYCEDGVRVEKLPEDFYSTRSYTEKVIGYIDDAPADKPIMGYLAFTAPHDPLHIIDEWSHRYDGVYDGGYDAIKRARHNRQIELGLIPASTPYRSTTIEWESLSDEQKREQSRKMEIYAAMLEYTDYSIGRVIDKLKECGRYDNTLFIFISDNGANPKEPHFYPGNSIEQIAAEYNNALENYGKKDSFISLGKAWAEVCSTPHRDYKMVVSEGGINTPLIISGKGITQGDVDKTSLLHITDIMPTILEMTGLEYAVEGRELAPLYGKAIGSAPRTEDDILCFEMMEEKAVIRGNWKAHLRTTANGGDGKTWALYNLSEDIAEQINLASDHPEILAELVEEWNSYAQSVGYIEFSGTMQNKILSSEEYYKYDIKNKQINEKNSN